ncbi:MAG: putative toxin-antitoxin system toxin component, PIN family [Candidatus Manganitrophaceae bacterium]
MRVILDTNVLLSGLILPDSLPGRIVQAWREARFDLVFSEEMLEEIRRILAYPKINKRLKWDADEIERFLLLLRLKCVTVNPSPMRFDGLRDSDDAAILSALIESNAEALITGDKDLLILANQYPILSPSEFAIRL